MFKVIRLIFVLLIGFILTNQNDFAIENNDSIKMEIDSNYYIIVDTNAIFQNGELNNFRTYIQQNVIVPESSDSTVLNKLIFTFGVDWNGDIQNIKLLRSFDYNRFDNEFVKMIKSSPKWIPAIKDNKRVGQLFTMTMLICLQE